MDFEALWLTLRLAGATTAILLAVALPLAWWIASGRGMGRALVQAVVALPLVLPPTVIGFYLLVALGPSTGPGRLLVQMLGHPLAFSFAGLLVGSVVYSLPFAVQPFTAAFRAVPGELLEAAWSVGATRARTFFRIAVPLAWPGLLAGMVLSFAHTLGEFGVVLMVGGNIPGITRTVSVSIYDAVQGLDYESAGRTAAVLLLISFAILSATYALQRDFRLAPTRPR